MKRLANHNHTGFPSWPIEAKEAEKSQRVGNSILSTPSRSSRLFNPSVRAAQFLALSCVCWFVSAVCLQAAGHGHQTLSGVQSLDVFANGSTLDVLVADYQSGTNPPVILHQRSTDAGSNWSVAVRVDAGMPQPRQPHRGSDAQIAGHGKDLIAIWSMAGTGFMGSGPMVTAISSDGGRTWKQGPNPADDQLTTGHGYADIGVGSDGVFHLVWLDSRDGKQGLRYARSKDRGRSWSANQTLKAEICECCWNSIAVNGRRVAVLFRDKSPRDMKVIASADGGDTWGNVQTVGAFNWEFQGCPHVGGGLAWANGGKGPLHALVWSGAEGQSGLHALTSDGAVRSWSKPVRLGTAEARRADVAANGKKLAAVWEAVMDGESVVFASRSEDGARTWSLPRMLSKPGMQAAYPRVVAVADGFRVFWTESPPHGSGAWQHRLVP